MKSHDRFDFALHSAALEILRQAPAGIVMTMAEAIVRAEAERVSAWRVVNTSGPLLK